MPPASQVLLDELSALETECETERMCRQRAEAYAAQVRGQRPQSPQPLPAGPRVPVHPPSTPARGCRGNPGAGGVSIPLQVKQENQELKRLSLAPLAPLALPQEQPPQEQSPRGDPDPHYGQQLQGELGRGAPAKTSKARGKARAPAQLPGPSVP